MKLVNKEEIAKNNKEWLNTLKEIIQNENIDLQEVSDYMGIPEEELLKLLKNETEKIHGTELMAIEDNIKKTLVKGEKILK